MSPEISVHAYNNKHAGIQIAQGKHVIVAQCICSGHDHVAVRNQGQSYGIHVGAGAKDVIVKGNITHSNKKKGVVFDAKPAGKTE